ncbi:MAG: acetone carboxylase subunit gamma [bacterium]
MTVQYPKDMIRDLIAGKLPWETVKQIMSSQKDDGRLEIVLEVEQERVPWKDKILLPLAEHLYIVQKDNGARIVKTFCGHELGDYRENWKEQALVLVRDTEESMHEVFPGPRSCEVRKMHLREFICPGCGELLEVEAVPPGYPILFDFLPDLEALEEK